VLSACQSTRAKEQYGHAQRFTLHDVATYLQLYTTGCFLFALMYTGSNVLPIAKFLHATHMKQAVRNNDIRTLADRRCVLLRR
jgi:hypothetical protein